MLDKDFLQSFNASSPARPYTMEEVIKMFNEMPNQRIGTLFDTIRWVKKDAANVAKFISVNDRMSQLPSVRLSSRYIPE